MSAYKFPHINKCAKLGYTPIVVYAFGEEFMAGIIGPELAKGVCADSIKLMTEHRTSLGLQTALHTSLKEEVNKVHCLIGEQTLTLELFEHINNTYKKEAEDA